jgi:hypothetical protein
MSELTADKVYISPGEAVIYRDGKIHAVTTISKIDEEFFKTMKLIFPDSDVTILPYDKTDNGVVAKEEVNEEDSL